MPPGTTVTPQNTSHCLFGKTLTVIKEEAEWVEVELKDAVHDIKARFEKASVVETKPDSPEPATTPTPEAAPTPEPTPTGSA